MVLAKDLDQSGFVFGEECEVLDEVEQPCAVAGTAPVLGCLRDRAYSNQLSVFPVIAFRRTRFIQGTTHHRSRLT